MRAKEKADSKINALISDILKGAGASAPDQLQAWKDPESDIRRLVRNDYVHGLRRNLGYQHVRALVAAFEDILPGLNREPVGMMSTEMLAARASELRLHFKAAPYDGEEGRLLRGFYVTRKPGILKRPLIYVNTAYHPLAISTTFCHEVGHHVSARIFETGPQPVHFFFDADYAGHLGDPAELAADVMVSLAGYPEVIARKIFETPWNWGLVAKAKNLTEAALAEVQRHLRKVYSFDLIGSIPASQRLHYLSGMIHYAKLRWALLAEYDL